MKQLKKGNIIQIERKGFFIVDKAFDGSDIALILIPGGKPQSTMPRDKDYVFNMDKSSKIIYKMKPLYESFDFESKAVKQDKAKENSAKQENLAKQEKSTKQAPAPVQNDEIEDPVQLVDLRVGKVLSVKRHENADSLYVEQIDLGEDQPRTVVSGIVKYI
ncbi:hypothetical protein ROZALSC1DRAFT_25848 [Rozella allomycis CSF55]|uniref:Nucleic acid-binding protein n=1 Tax=Rozella allomycis (strain CSF55) TaxID=988480 RepID=A0A4P9Y9T8_ROZAC|nr:hypothetical protein ROZALSC1DRAFT_25848 [Rozella allomycis CSF55]